jgi:hypothetical protein
MPVKCGLGPDVMAVEAPFFAGQCGAREPEAESAALQFDGAM